MINYLKNFDYFLKDKRIQFVIYFEANEKNVMIVESFNFLDKIIGLQL